jgi:hypothetical protein
VRRGPCFLRSGIGGIAGVYVMKPIVAADV